MASPKSKNKSSERRDKYPLIQFSSIKIVDRPQAGEEHLKLFYNPRSMENFTPESMTELLLSICRDGLQQPLVVRAVGDTHELIAGERRLRTIQRIIKEKRPCFDEDTEKPDVFKAGETVLYRGNFSKVVSSSGDQVCILILDENLEPNGEELQAPYEDVYPTVCGSQLYEQVACRVVKDCTDERALRLAFTDNDKHKSFHIREEILLVERLLKRGLKQGEITEVLGVNETWVSHTLNFRDQLPKEAFEKLIAGEMTRNVAVHIMSYKPEDRKALYEAAVKAEQEETKKTLQEQQEVVEQEEDAAELAEHDVQVAESSGDESAKRKAARKAQKARQNVSKARDKKDKVASEAGVIRQSHVQKGAAASGVTPKKPKILPSAEINSVFVEGLVQYMDGSELDPVCGEEIPADLIALMSATATAIIRGERDPLKVLRTFMIDQGRWEAPEEDEEIDEDGVDTDDDDDEGDYSHSLADIDDDYDSSQDLAELESCFGDRFDDDDFGD